MYDALTAHRWVNWDGYYCNLDMDDWEWMINAGKNGSISDDPRELYRKMRAQSDTNNYTPEQIEADPYGKGANKPRREPHHKRSYNKWTDAEIERLGTAPDSTIAERMGIKVQSVRMKRRDMKIARFVEAERERG